MMDGKYTPGPEVSTITVSGGGITLSVARYGKVCTVSMSSQTTAAITNWTQLCQMPEGYRPAVAVFADNIASDGVDYLCIQPASNGGGVYSGADLPSGHYLYITATYVVGG